MTLEFSLCHMELWSQLTKQGTSTQCKSNWEKTAYANGIVAFGYKSDSVHVVVQQSGPAHTHTQVLYCEEKHAWDTRHYGCRDSEPLNGCKRWLILLSLRSISLAGLHHRLHM
eukprot:996834-Amphidinium_carterae.2